MNGSLPFRPNVCMIVFKDAQHIFLGERMDFPGVWQFPQGGVEPELSLEENVLKELHEELGLLPHQVKIERKLQFTYSYKWWVTPPCYEGRFCGQSQTFWCVRFLGRDSDINLRSHDQIEFSNWEWVRVEELIARADLVRRESYQEVIKEFQAYVASSHL